MKFPKGLLLVAGLVGLFMFHGAISGWIEGFGLSLWVQLLVGGGLLFFAGKKLF